MYVCFLIPIFTSVYLSTVHVLPSQCDFYQSTFLGSSTVPVNIAALVMFVYMQIIPADKRVPLCALSTIVACLPSMFQQLWRPSSRGLVLSMANCGAAFFMLSYQVGSLVVVAAAPAGVGVVAGHV